MPTYQYQCTQCGQDLEVQQSFSDPSLTECPACQGRLRKVFNAVGVVFKGSGFYRNDSRTTGGGKDGESGSKDGAATAKDSGPTDSGSKGSDAKGAGSKDSGSNGSTGKDAGSSKPTSSGSGASGSKSASSA